MSEDFRYEIEGLEDFIETLGRIDKAVLGTALANAAWKGAGVIQELANDYAPGPHIIRVPDEEFPGKVTILIGPDKEHWYYTFFETGASAHEIGIKNKEALRLYGFGGGEFAFEVDHPGMAAEPFMRPAVDTGKDTALRTAGDYLLAAILKAARS